MNQNLINTLKQEHPEIFKELKMAFKGNEAMMSWLNNPKKPLNGKAPVDELENNPDRVLDMLIRMKTGDFS